MPQQREYRRIDVCNETGASFKQLTYWVRKGLLPHPEFRGRYTVYPQSYVDQVRRIMAEYEKNITANDLRDRFFPVEDP